MKRIVLALCATALLMLAGCSDAPVLVRDYSAPFSPGEWGYTGGEMPLLVRGNPFAVPQAEFAQAVSEEMRGWGFGPEMSFKPEQASNAAYRVAMVFDPPVHATAYALCQRPLAAEPVFGLPPAPRTPVIAALCRGDQPLTAIQGSIATDGGPRGSAFSWGIGQVTQALFPPYSNDNEHPHGMGVCGRRC